MIAQSDVDQLVSPETGVTLAVGLRGPWVFLLMRNFAGPSTEWRAMPLADAPGGADGVRVGDTFEVAFRTSWRPRRMEGLVVTDGGVHGARVLVPSAGGVALGELLDETAKQKAHIDASYAVHLLAALAPSFLLRVADGGGGAVSVDNVLIGFDGSVFARGDLPWWPRRRPARLPSGVLTPTDDAESVRLFGELAAELFASRRFDVRTGLSFPGHEGTVRKEARAFVQWLLETPIAPDVEDLWQEVDVPLLAEVSRRIDSLRKLVDPVPPLALATFVRHLFPERAKQNDAIVEQVAALSRSN